MPERKPHILLKGFRASEAFQSRNRGGGGRVRALDRAAHGQALSQQYADILQRVDIRRPQTPQPITDETGIYVEILGYPGIPLPLKSLDTRDFQLRLCREIEGQEIATVFIPESRRLAFHKKITDYLNPEKDGKNGYPRNQPLLDSISEVRLADLKAFWTDAADRYPHDPDQAIWWELWLKTATPNPVAPKDNRLAPRDIAHQLAERIGARLGNTSLTFFGSYVILIHASARQLEAAPELIANLEELRQAKETPNVLINMDPKEQHSWMDSLIARIRIDDNATTSVAILDAGVNFNHPLLSRVCVEQESDCWDPDWAKYDNYQHGAPYNDHGSTQAGLAALGNLQPIIIETGAITLCHRIESGRILPPVGANDPELYGAITVGTAAKLEINQPDYNRVYSLAVTVEPEAVGGQPSSWSAEIDQFTSGIEDGAKRLFVISAGNNVSLIPEVDIWDQIQLAQIEDPAQSWNALSVGAYTEKTTNDELALNGWSPLSGPGDLAPASRSSVNWGWKKHAPYKPDLVAEGGNRLLSPDGTQITDEDVVSLLTTSGRTTGQLFETSRDTSAASALVSGQAAALMAEYPNYWPETIRALLVHSAEWTPRIWERLGLMLRDHSPSRAKELMLRCAGYGVPNLERARYSANHLLTLVAQDSLQPYIKDENANASDDPKLNEMQLYQLPWPVNALRQLPPEQEVKLNVTLSYFIEPNPGRRGYRDRYRYQSHGLRFDVIRPGESVEGFRASLNRIANEEMDAFNGREGDAGGWQLGPSLRTRGSLHSDTWVGSAADLVDMNTIAVYPVSGWWKYRPAEDRWRNVVRYSLIVSIDVPDEEINIYSEIENLIDIPVGVET